MGTHRVEKDPEALTMTVVAELDVTVERAWELWADPRQFERWWGPAEFPTTVLDHDLRTGGRITFFMGEATGERLDAVWEVVAADPPQRLELRDADVDEHGRPNDGNGVTTMVITFAGRDGGGTDMAITTTFESLEGMEATLASGYDEGMAIVLSQIDALLAGSPA